MWRPDSDGLRDCHCGDHDDRRSWNVVTGWQTWSERGLLEPWVHCLQMTLWSLVRAEGRWKILPGFEIFTDDALQEIWSLSSSCSQAPLFYLRWNIRRKMHLWDGLDTKTLNITISVSLWICIISWVECIVTPLEHGWQSATYRLGIQFSSRYFTLSTISPMNIQLELMFYC